MNNLEYSPYWMERAWLERIFWMKKERAISQRLWIDYIKLQRMRRLYYSHENSADAVNKLLSLPDVWVLENGNFEALYPVLDLRSHTQLSEYAVRLLLRNPHILAIRVDNCDIHFIIEESGHSRRTLSTIILNTPNRQFEGILKWNNKDFCSTRN